MIAVVQRVNEAGVTVPSAGHAAVIGRGLCVLLGVLDGDAERDAAWMARKLANLRIFGDDQGRMNRAIAEVGGEILLVSQFTLAGDCRRGKTAPASSLRRSRRSQSPSTRPWPPVSARGALPSSPECLVA